MNFPHVRAVSLVALRAILMGVLGAVPAPLLAQLPTVVHVTNGDAQGNGFLRALGDECYAIAPLHVVEPPRGGILRVRSGAPTEARANVVLGTRIDVAVIKLDNRSALPCGREWERLRSVSGALNDPSLADLALHHRQGDGSLLQLPVRIVQRGRTSVQIQSLLDGRAITRGMSGSLLAAGSVPLGMLDSVETSNGRGIALRLDYMLDVTESFFSRDRAAENDAAAVMLARLRSRVASGQVASVGSCRRNSCSFHPRSDIAPVVRRLVFGTDRMRLDRTIDLTGWGDPSDARGPFGKSFQIRGGVDTVFAQFILDDGSRGMLQAFPIDHAGNPLAAATGAQLVPVRPDTAAPPVFAELAHSTNGTPQLRVRVDAPLSAAALHYSHDEGGDELMMELPNETPGFFELSAAPEARRLRLVFADERNQRSRAFTYGLPSVDSLEALANSGLKGRLEKRLATSVTCYRIPFRWPVPRPTTHDKDEWEAHTREESKAQMALSIPGGPLHVETAPSLHCVRSPGSHYDWYDWAAAAEISMGTTADRLERRIQNAFRARDAFSNRAPDADVIRATFPVDAAAAYLQVTYRDGSKGRLVRLPIRTLGTP